MALLLWSSVAGKSCDDQSSKAICKLLCWLVRIDIALPEVMQCVWYMSVCHWYERMLFYTAGIVALSG